ncbi:protein PAT1 homolog 1 [Coccinella septempunctata]|uniref:protein PAT1 homolog 1 n=1 Tax=Coccinella septempunctata TaxID=41139 RepID=UPI001D087BAA|nr:protein PAT1 homolog 1 [Coccinella septempunctata]
MKNLNQMAESSFFNFPTLKDSEQITLPEDDNCLENEDEYDALNDETFGDLECDSTVDDWEQQHEKFAEFAKKSSKQDEIVDSLKDLVLSSSPLNLTGNSVWAYTPTPPRNGETTTAIQNLLPRTLKRLENKAGDEVDAAKTFAAPANLTTVPKICTVEELEKNLIKSNNVPNCPRPPPGYRAMPPPAVSSYYLPTYPRPPPSFQGHPHHPPYPMGPNRYPPGFPPANMPPPMRHVMYPPRFRPLPPPHHSFLKGGNMPQRPPPGLPFPNHLNHQGPAHLQRGGMHMMPPHVQNMHPMQQQQYHHHLLQQQQQYQLHQGHQMDRRQINDPYRDKNAVRDEYEGLMTAREKQWLLNIQMLQLNTGTPYFDDYYYTIYKERKARSNKENQQQLLQRHQAGRQRRNSDRQESPLTPKVYTPLQFENSLGKLQCGSVMAPRKIIDMDVVSCDKDSENTSVCSRDSKKIKQLLLELEALYSMFLKAEDLTNPMAISNLKTLKEIKLKQRIRELENATTPEQKREILELVKKDSETVVENPHDYMQKIVNGLLQEDKFASFMNIRKGKMLLLRLLPAIHSEQFFPQIVEIWGRLLSSIAIIGRRDTAGDKILPKLYPLFKRYTQTVKMENILDNIHGLMETTKSENNRSTPLGHQSKTPLYFVLMNQFGISAMTAFFVRSELLMSTDEVTDVQQATLFGFIQTVADLLSQIPKIPTPLEGMSQVTLNKLCQRIPNLNPDKTSILRKHFVESND